MPPGQTEDWETMISGFLFRGVAGSRKKQRDHMAIVLKQMVYKGCLKSEMSVIIE